VNVFRARQGAVAATRRTSVIVALSVLTACVSISSSELRSIGSVVTVQEIDFAALHGDAERAHTAYAPEAAIRAQYPAVTRISVPGGTDVLYFLEQDDRARTQYVTVRGTIDKKNLSEDLDIHVQQDAETGIPIHAGFDVTADILYIDLKPHLKQGYKTYLTGHSLGGAIAAVLAIYASRDGHDVVRVVTFGQPRFTTEAGVEQLADIPIIRVVDENDMVPMLPPATKRHAQYGPYEHTGQEIILLDGPHYVFLSSHDANRIAIGEFWRSMKYTNLNDHKMTNYLARLAAKTDGAIQVPYNKRETYITNARPS
jgi:hypothetical protein